MSLCNTSGPIGDDHRLYRLPGQFQQGQCVDWRVSLMVVEVLQVGVQTLMVKTD